MVYVSEIDGVEKTPDVGQSHMCQVVWDCTASPLLRKMAVLVFFSRPGLVVAYFNNSEVWHGKIQDEMKQLEQCNWAQILNPPGIFCINICKQLSNLLYPFAHSFVGLLDCLMGKIPFIDVMKPDQYIQLFDLKLHLNCSGGEE